MTDVAELERQWKHAAEIAFESIGQADRAENVTRRDELYAQLEKARAAASVGQGTHP